MATATQPPPVVQTQPRLTRVSLRGLLSLPFRICNPPPAVGKARSCTVTPLYKIKLEDVLERKHLPPLGLKDFEEWLLYVEMSPENLYFTLWLKEYTAKYNQWVANNKMLKEEHSGVPVNWAMCSSSHLTMFYARAKQTFFTPNSVYELNLPSSMLAPFHAPNGSPHPDPSAFTEVAIEVQKMLQDSLRRFVAGQLTNVGTQRVLCGIIAGTLFCLLGSIAPIAVNITQGHSRWARLAAFPGMWLGLSILFAALNGVCLGVYVFGDLRQLRRFELSRPPISKPQPLRAPRRPETISSSSPSHPLPLSREMQARLSFPPLAHVASPSGSVTISRAISASSRTSVTSSRSGESMSSSASGSVATRPPPPIQISQAFYDPNPIEGPAISPIMSVPTAYKPYPPPPRHPPQDSPSASSSFTTTASFIHPFELVEDEWDVEKLQTYSEKRQPLSDFDFEALPHLRRHQFNRPSHHHNSYHARHQPLQQQPKNLPDHQKGFLARLQTRCAQKVWGRPTLQQQHPSISGSESTETFTRSAKGSAFESDQSLRKSELSLETTASSRFKRIAAVPAFSALTRVLNPIIVRGQWEIVVRSALLSFLVCWIVLGSLLAVPVLA